MSMPDPPYYNTKGRTALGTAVRLGNYEITTLLLRHGASPDTGLSSAISSKNVEIVALLLEHGANAWCSIDGINAIEWASSHSRDNYRLLKDQLDANPATIIETTGDIIEAAAQGDYYLNDYIAKQTSGVSRNRLEKALNESIRLGRFDATVSLLQHGVNPNCPSLNAFPFETALKWNYPDTQRFCELLLAFGANIQIPGIWAKIVKAGGYPLLNYFISSGETLDEVEEALMEAVRQFDIPSTALLLDLGVDIDTPHLAQSPLQAISQNLEDIDEEMIMFLVERGANVNVPAYPDGGLTVLQGILHSDIFDLATMILEKGADVAAPPALVGGRTALEAIAHNFVCHKETDNERREVCNLLLDAGAPVNRPNGKPSSALHGAIACDWDDIVRRILEPKRNAIIDYMWYDPIFAEDSDFIEPRTPVQLAAELGQITQIRMLLDRGANINEAPAYKFGRTALQAAASAERPNMELLRLLIDRGAYIDAEPAVHGGITALQGAAISGNIGVAMMLIENGADVNARPSPREGRYAIEGAAEHGRLDMIQLLLNAGAKGDVLRGTDFKFAISLAKEKGFFAIVNLLEEAAKAGDSI